MNLLDKAALKQEVLPHCSAGAFLAPRSMGQGCSWTQLIWAISPQISTWELCFIGDNIAESRGHGMNSSSLLKKMDMETLETSQPHKFKSPGPSVPDSSHWGSPKPKDRWQLQGYLDSLNPSKAIWQHLGRVLSSGVGLALLFILAGKRGGWRCLRARVCASDVGVTKFVWERDGCEFLEAFCYYFCFCFVPTGEMPPSLWVSFLWEFCAPPLCYWNHPKHHSSFEPFERDLSEPLKRIASDFHVFLSFYLEEGVVILIKQQFHYVMWGTQSLSYWQ